MKKIALLALCSLVLATSAWAETKVAVSVVPQRYFVEKIAGDAVSIVTMVPEGASPATYEPKPSQMGELAKCSLWFTIGVPFGRAQKDRMLSALPNLKEIPTHDNVKLRPIEGHDHDGQGHQHDQGYDPHVWLSPSAVMIQARTIATALSELDPKNRAVYMKNYAAFVAELASLDSELAEILSSSRGKAFMVFHPSWGYFAHDYGLEQIAVEVEGKEPKPAELAKMVQRAKVLGIKTVFVQPQFSTTAAEAIAKSIEGQVVPLNPLAEDWQDNLLRAANSLRKASF
ncbi:MAG: zinc ABC transporter substrate-binding protein [Dethiosulfovibrio sp.]|nr:zinc ABC transporter substrate-binding protein [Dethiosulfovibrio sp.]